MLHFHITAGFIFNLTLFIISVIFTQKKCSHITAETFITAQTLCCPRFVKKDFFGKRQKGKVLAFLQEPFRPRELPAGAEGGI